LQFTIHTAPTAPPASQKLLSGLQEQVGFIPNLAATMAGSPALLQAFLGLRQAAGATSWDPVSRELLSIAVGVEAGCRYCVAAHSTFARKSGASPEAVEAARSGKPLPDPRLESLVAFARAVVRRQGVRARAEELAKTGIGPAQILDLLALIAVPALAGMVAELTEVELDTAFRPQAWARPD